MTYAQFTPAQRPTLLQSHSLHSPFAALVVSFAQTLLTWEMRYKTRKSLRNMTNADLDDIGLTRAQAYTEARRKFWQG